MKYKVIDNFLEPKLFKEFKDNIFNDSNTPWFFRKSQQSEGVIKTNPWFSLCFFNEFKNDFRAFDMYLNEIYKKLDCKSLINSRANLTIASRIKFNLYWHNDYLYKNSKTAIFYLNNTDGNTFLKINNKKIGIECVENRMLIFSSDIKHAAGQHTNAVRRIVLNINYF